MNEEYEYSSEELNQMANRLDLFSIVCQHQQCVKRQGRNYFFHCNNNPDSDASLVVDRENNFFKCFSCGASGNLISYYMAELGYTFKEAAEEVVRLSGGTYRQKPTPDCLKVLNRYKRLTAPHTEPTSNRVYGDFYRDYEYKFDGSQMPQEWIDEGISEKVMREFDVRIDRYSERIVYPLYDADNRFITAKGRTRLKDFKKLGIPKYISYTKIGTVDFFVGYRENSQAILQNSSVIIFEGVKSVMKAKDYGCGICVASETSHLNEYQIKLLLRSHIKSVTVAYDKDKTYQDVVPQLQMLRRFTNCYVILDRENLLGEKMSPVDNGKDVFRRLYEHRIRI